MGSPFHRGWTCFLALACAAIGFADPRDFEIDAKPVFQGVSMGFGSMPVAISIENKGPNARGQLLVGSGETTTRYPIDLPQGSKKRLITYPSQTPLGSEVEFVLDTDQGRIKIPFIPTGSYAYGGSNLVAMISATSGDLGFLRQEERRNPNQNSSYFDTYCKPEDAPDRPVGYGSIGVVVLGEGAERLSDDAVKALQLYALAGGTIVVSGGASAPVLTDRRWASVLPASGFQTKTIPGNGLVAQLTGAPLEESYTISAGTPTRTASAWRDNSGNLVAASRPLGLGKVVLLAFNMFEDPFIRWSGRKRLFTMLSKPGDFNRAIGFLGPYEAAQGYDYYGGSYTTTYYSAPGTTAGYSSGVIGGPPPGISTYAGANNYGEGDPFDVELPSPNKVFGILAAFFVVVVPLNFLVLRKLKRGELAWVTAPVISLVFAGIFLNQASDLYAANLSTATTGVLLAQEGVPNAMFVGNTQMFFPNGGAYDLKLQNVDELGGSARGMEYSFDRQTSRTDLDPVDTGTVQVPDMRAANLAFEQISYRQVYPAERFLDAKILDGFGRVNTVRITNTSKHRLAGLSIAARGRMAFVGDLEPGDHKDLAIDFSKKADPGEEMDALTAITVRNRVMVALATLDDLRPGPQIGQQVGKRSHVQLAYTMDEPKGASR